MKPGIVLAMAGLACLEAPPTAAQVLEEITVTARKVEESLQDAPVAVSVLTGDSLRTRGVAQLNDVQNFAPNLTFFPSGIMGESSGQVYIRGVGQFDFFVTADPGVGIYIDGVYLGRSLGNLLDVVDVERIEVLRGPQGTLYGKNTIGGAINVITRKPQDKFEGYVDLKTGSYSRIDARGNVSLPIVEGVLAAKIAAGTRNADGYGSRPLAGDETGDQHADVVQAQLNWTPQENLQALLSFDYTNIDQKLGQNHVELFTGQGLAGLYNALAGPLQPLHGVEMQPFDDRWYSPDPYVSNATGSNFLQTDIWGVSAVIDWNAGPVAVKSITAYRKLHERIGIDPDGSPEEMIDEIDDIHQKQFSQEFQVSGLSFDDRLKWVSGLYYMREESESDTVAGVATKIFPALEGLPAPILPLGPYQCPPPEGAPANYPPCLGGAGNPYNVIFDLPQHNHLDQTTDSYAGYAQGSWDFNDRLSGTLGLRYTHDKKDFAVSSVRLRTPVPLLPYTEQNDSWSDTSWHVGLDFHATGDVLLYATAAQGFKSGGFNGRARNTAELEGYGPETLLGYEVGMKSEWLERRLRLNLAAFYNDYQDIQLTEQHLDPNTGTQTIVTQNAGDAKIKGFEAELEAAAGEHLRLDASVGYLDAKYTKISPEAAATGLTLHHKLIGTPEWTASGGAELFFQAGDAGKVSFRADVHYRAKTYFQLLNDESIAQTGYSLINLRLAFDSADGRWSVATGVTNAADKVYRASGVSVGDSLGFTVGWYGRPREWYLQGGFHF